MEMMSSEDSEDEQLCVKPISWCSEKVENFFSQLDSKSMADKSEQAKRQTKQRIEGDESTRPKPDSTEYPAWALL